MVCWRCMGDKGDNLIEHNVFNTLALYIYYIQYYFPADNTAAIVGGVIGGILGLLVIIAIVVVVVLGVSVEYIHVHVHCTINKSPQALTLSLHMYS